jgi:hypothetical protein
MTVSLGRATVCLATGLLLAPKSGQQSNSPLGRWVGESHCVGAHPACHDEHVIYQVDSAGPHRFMLDGSRFAGRDTVDMGALSCEGTGSQPTIICHIPDGAWHFSVVQGHLEGSLILNDSTVMRRVVAYRAQPN